MLHPRSQRRTIKLIAIFALAISAILTRAADAGVVLVRDGATAVIGGIYQSNEQTSQGRTPFLANLPFVGGLFRNRFITNTNNELLLFITPRIIRG